MEFGTFERQAQASGDSLKASDAVNKPLIVAVSERREGIVTKYQPAGGPGLIVDVADVNADQVFVGVLWMNGPIVDNLTAYLGQTVPVKLVYEANKSGTNSYITVEALKGADMDAVTTWAQANPSRFDQRRAELAAESGVKTPQTAAAGPAAAPAGGTPDQAQIAALLASLQGNG